MSIQDSDDLARRATEQAELILGAISVVVWLVVTFWLIMIWNLTNGPPPVIMSAGAMGLIIAALPWMLVSRLAERLRQRQLRASGPEK